MNQSTATVNVNTTQGIEISQGDYQTVETGGSAGNKIFVFTKRGTNAFHGSVAYWGRNDALDARNFFNLPDFKTLRNHNGSAQLGGPLWKDKAFFFGSYELIRGVQAPTFSPVLTSELSALNQALLRLGLPAENLRRFVTDQRSDSPLIRIDYQPNDKHSLWWRYGFEGTGWRKDFVGGINAPSSARDFSGRNHLFGFRHEWSVSQSFHVETGYSYLHDSATLAPVEANQVSLLIPGVALLGRTMSLVEGDGYRQRHHLISENVTIAQGRHTLRFGGLFGRDQNLFRFATFQSGRAIVPGLTALSAIPPRADLFQIGAGGSEVSFSVSSLEFYAQDDFRLTPRVTLNLGLRYKAELPPSFQVKDTNGWQPRIGLAWVCDQNSKTVVRMGYGVYRGYIPQLPIGFGLLQGGGFQSGAPPPVRRVSSYVGNLAASNALNQFLTTGSAPPGPQLATFSDRTSTGSLTQNASLTVQRQLRSRLTLEVSYLYSRGDHLLTSTNVNLPPPTLINGRPDFGNGALNPNFAQVYEFRTIGKSEYHSGRAGIRMPPYNGLTLSAYYTFSRTIDDVPLGSYEATPENVFDRRSERSVSDFNLAHNFSLTTVWEVPQPPSKRLKWVRRWFGRQDISGVLLLRSGPYFNVLVGSDANHDGNPLTDRPLGVARNTFLGPRFAQLDIRAASRYFVLKEVKEGMELGWTVDFFNLLNRANFTNINTVLGQADLTGVDPRIVFGRNGLPSFDFRGPLTPSGFGLATSAATPRRIQFGLKLSF